MTLNASVESLTPPQYAVLCALERHDGEASFNHMLFETGLSALLFINNARELITLELVEQGETFDVFRITELGVSFLKSKMISGIAGK